MEIAFSAIRAIVSKIKSALSPKLFRLPINFAPCGIGMPKSAFNAVQELFLMLLASVHLLTIFAKLIPKSVTVIPATKVTP